jgi:hypothetical protein
MQFLQPSLLVQLFAACVSCEVSDWQPFINIHGVNMIQSWRGPDELGPVLTCVVIDCATWLDMGRQIAKRYLQETLEKGFTRMMFVMLYDPVPDVVCSAAREDQHQQQQQAAAAAGSSSSRQQEDPENDQCATDEEDPEDEDPEDEDPEDVFYHVKAMLEALDVESQNLKTVPAALELLGPRCLRKKVKALTIDQKPEPELPASLLYSLCVPSMNKLALARSLGYFLLCAASFASCCLVCCMVVLWFLQCVRKENKHTMT